MLMKAARQIVGRRPFKQQTTCRKCGQARKYTSVTQKGTATAHHYECGSVATVDGHFDQSNRCKRRAEKQEQWNA